MKINDRLISLARFVAILQEKFKMPAYIYGSVAFAYYAPDQDMVVGDIDYLVSEQYFPRICAALEGQSLYKFEKLPWKSIRIFFGEEYVDIDSLEEYGAELTGQLETAKIGGQVECLLLSREDLIEMYRRGAMDDQEKKFEYERKLEVLAGVAL